MLTEGLFTDATFGAVSTGLPHSDSNNTLSSAMPEDVSRCAFGMVVHRYSNLDRPYPLNVSGVFCRL